MSTTYTVLNKEDLQRDGTNLEFQGYLYGNTGVSFIMVDLPPGGGPRLHRHDYAEIMIIQEGRGTYTVDSATLEAGAGQILIIPAGLPHKFVNSGDGQLRQIDIHLNKQFATEWLES
jgi:mannose-6-phosphate isomerase-like protein (cupin superfamily)